MPCAHGRGSKRCVVGAPEVNTLAEISNTAGSTQGRHTHSYSHSHTQRSTDVLLTRRQLREREQKPSSRRASRAAAPSGRSKKTRGTALNVVVMTFAAGLVATMALPAYAFNPAKNAEAGRKVSDIRGLSTSQAQTDAVSSAVAATPVNRDGFTVKAASIAPDAAAQRAAAAQRLAPPSTPSTPSVPAPVEKAPDANLAGGAVFAYAKRFIGVPYVFGGESSSGLDCSGLVKLVFAHFGIDLTHSAAAQASFGTRISAAEARPGDLVYFPSGHIGIFAGGNQMLDAPHEGLDVRIESIFSESHYFVRIG